MEGRRRMPRRPRVVPTESVSMRRVSSPQLRQPHRRPRQRHDPARAVAACTSCVRAHSAVPPAPQPTSAARQRPQPPPRHRPHAPCHQRQPHRQRHRVRRRTLDCRQRSRTPPAAAQRAARPPSRAPAACAAPMRCAAPASRQRHAAGWTPHLQPQLHRPATAAGGTRIRRERRPRRPVVTPQAVGCRLRRARPRCRSARSRGQRMRPRPAAAARRACSAAPAGTSPSRRWPAFGTNSVQPRRAKAEP